MVAINLIINFQVMLTLVKKMNSFPEIDKKKEKGRQKERKKENEKKIRTRKKKKKRNFPHQKIIRSIYKKNVFRVSRPP